MRVPDLGPKVFVKDQDITPGITSWTQFLSEELGALYIVSTRIRDGLPKDDSILPRVASRYQRYLDGNPKGYTQQYTDGRYGKVFEFTLINARSGLGNYPLEITLQPATSIQTFASHRFFVTGGYLFEFALLIHTKGVALGLSTEELTKRASAVLDEAINAFTPISPQ